MTGAGTPRGQADRHWHEALALCDAARGPVPVGRLGILAPGTTGQPVPDPTGTRT